MGRIELILIGCACLIPVMALLFILPSIKRARKNRKNKAVAKVEEQKPAEANPATTQQADSNSSSGFGAYARNKKTTKPTFKPFNSSLPATSKYDFFSSDGPRPTQEKKTVKEQIDALSPELKAVLFSDIFSKKF